jgi:hypothetical protein
MPDRSHAGDAGAACIGAAVAVLAAASELFDVAEFVAFPDFATFDAVAEMLALTAALPEAVAGVGAAGMIVGTVILGGGAAGAGSAGARASRAAADDGCGSCDSTAGGCAFKAATLEGGVSAAAKLMGCVLGAAPPEDGTLGAAADGVVVAGAGAVARLAGGVADSAASKDASWLPGVAGGADAAGAVLSLGLTAAVAVADAPCALKPLSSEKKSMSALDEESGVPGFPALAPAPVAVVAAAEFAGADDTREEEAADTFLSAMCGSLGEGTTLCAFVRLALLGQLAQALLFIFPAIDESSDDLGTLRGVLPAQAFGVAFAASAHHERRLLTHGLRKAREKGLIIAQTRAADAGFGTLIELARVG